MEKLILVKNLDGKIYETMSSAKKWLRDPVPLLLPVPLSKKMIGKNWPLTGLYVPSRY